ncbi:hypothetical protein CAEBREN_32160 [Caenorhabditis brenneri]|uniref:G protein-coupled receptor n=1 Tax=Caenorhabditis brenneri TaxID=135651 RepID=G0P962_CAEBE|nr:hypothetical protein CAEBREN_32160 [Caenorhabditis brenneri]
MIPSGFNLFYISYGPCVKSGPEMCFNVYGIMLHFYSHSLWLLFLAFAYRYYVMLRHEPTRWFLQLTILIVYIPSLIMMIALATDHTDPKIVRKMLKSQFPDYDLSGLMITGSVDTTRFAAMFAIIHMSVALTLQAIIPVFYLLGVICYFISQFRIWSHPIIEFSIFTCFLLVPILTPLSSLIYVTPYKRYMLRLFKMESKENSKSRLHTNSMITLGV